MTLPSASMARGKPQIVPAESRNKPKRSPVPDWSGVGWLPAVSSGPN